MTKVVVDAATREVLANARNPLELCDDSGHVLGRFIPNVADSQRSALEPQISLEEHDRRVRQGGGRSLREIIADLEKRA
jgi:hypothetical protein